jgi:predicted ATPase
LKQFYPKLENWTTTALRAGWKDLRVSESYQDANRKPLETGARQINDGLLRLLAVLSQVEASATSPAVPALTTGSGSLLPRSCVLFDEIENGINPELMQRLVNVLLSADRQVIVTTHSPLILNFLPDDIAQQAVILLYRNEQGYARAVRLFDLPSARQRLKLLGPGEVFVDLDLGNLPTEAASLVTSAHP